YLTRRYGNRYESYRLPGRPIAQLRPRSCMSPSAMVQQTLFAIRSRAHAIDVVSLNLPVGLHRLVGRPVRYFAALRDPVERCLSAWRFSAATSKINPIWDACERLDFDIEQILTQPWSYEFR